MLYGSSFVAERYDAVGRFIETHRVDIGPDLDPTVSGIILAGADHTAAELFHDQATLEALAVRAEETFYGIDALLTPTTVGHPTLEDVAADPVGVNARLGRFTNFANLLDRSAVAIPAGFVDGLPFGVMLTAGAFEDGLLRGIVEELDRAGGLDVFVVGAHMSGQPLNRQLVALGADFVHDAATDASYRLYRLPGTPERPGLVCRDGDGAASVPGEVWSVPMESVGRLLAEIPAPLGLGRVTLSDGTDVVGFLCEADAVDGCMEITRYGGWRRWLERG